MYQNQAAPPPAQTAPAQTSATPASDPSTKIHDLALKAETSLAGLATELAHAGADPAATKSIQQMADVLRKLLKTMVGQAAAAPAPPQHTMASATDSLHQDLAANRGA